MADRSRSKGVSVLALTVGAVLLIGHTASAASSPQPDPFSETSLNTALWTETLGPTPSLTASPGWLTLSTVHAPVAQFATAPPNAVLQPVSSSSNWTVSVQATFFGKKFSPAGVALPPYQGGGIIAWQNAANWVSVRWQPSTCIMDMQAVIGGTFVINGTGNPTADTVACTQSDDPLWLRLSKQGDTYTGYYSTNGSTWSLVDLSTDDPATSTNMNGTLAPTYVGVLASEGGTSATPNPMGFRDFSVGSGSVSATSTSTASATTTSHAASSSAESTSSATKTTTSTSAVATSSTSQSSSSPSTKVPKTGTGRLLFVAGALITGLGALGTLTLRKARRV